ncbi:hypothetical protein ACFYV5_31095 [Streptomyces sp. NPDC003035]|uniref:hypothetical protein n=1 Tax=Streptomyces sp. NPDC003035 TaxID=3364676 RepID=UPI003689157E
MVLTGGSGAWAHSTPGGDGWQKQNAGAYKGGELDKCLAALLDLAVTLAGRIRGQIDRGVTLAVRMADSSTVQRTRAAVRRHLGVLLSGG